VGLVYGANWVWAVAWYNKIKEKMTRDQKKPQSGYFDTRAPKFLMSGFTVTELLVVCSIMVVLASVVLVSWNNQKPTRSLVIAQNELVTNIRKVQGYAVSSRNIVGSDTSVKFYYIRLETGQNFYTVHAIDYDFTEPPQTPLETINLPSDLAISRIGFLDNAGDSEEYSCAYIIFSAVYGKTYFASDNVACDTDYITELVKNPVTLAKQGDANLELSVTHQQTSSVKSVQVDAQTGRVEPYVYKKKSGR
jgi:type II secretory pathway pseudopilin PulG